MEQLPMFVYTLIGYAVPLDPELPQLRIELISDSHGHPIGLIYSPVGEDNAA